MKRGSNVAYYGNGNGRWLRREWKAQCSTKVFYYGRCQGVKGHKGVHWCYSPSGDFCWDDNDADPKHDGCCGTTPPGHENYASPAKMQKYLHLNFYSDAEVTDKAIVAMLNKGKTPEPEATLDRPISKRGKAKLVRAGILTDGD